MAQPPIGLKEAVGIGVESTYGTGVEPGVWFRPTLFTLRRAWVPLSMAGVSGSSADVIYHATKPRAFRSAPVIAGQIGFEADYENLGYILYALTGQESAVNTSHTFTIASDPATLPPGLSIARVTGLSDLKFTGCKVSGMTLTASPGATVQVVLDIIGQQGGEAVDDDAAVTSAMGGPFMLFEESNIMYFATVSTSLTVGSHAQSGDAAVGSWSLSVAHDYRIAEAAGTGLIREPVKQGHTVSTISFDRDWADTTFWLKMANAGIEDVFASLGVNVTDGSLAFDAQIPHALLMGDQNTEFGGSPGVIPESISAKAADDLSEAPLTIALTTVSKAYTQAASVA
jgi:hypothetical protein